MQELYIGLMSGTSIDSVDAALVDFSSTFPKLVAAHKHPIPQDLLQALIEICSPGFNEINRLGELDVQVGRLFAEATHQLLSKIAIKKSEIRAIGSHGQTIRHQPNATYPFTMQIGDPNIIAYETGITTVADFRRKDIAAGGQGAPLVPAFHASIFHITKENRIILNIGGMANITILSADQTKPVIGFDTGPGNTLLDAWIQQHLQKPYDQDGAFAASGKINEALLETLLTDPYFLQAPPKSTGREYFNLHWLSQKLQRFNELSSADIQATLLELTAASIIRTIDQYAPTPCKIFVCGGGYHNKQLMHRLKSLGAAKHHFLDSTEACGIHPDWMETIAFAWLAQQTVLHKPSNLPSVTGANKPVVLGGIYFNN